MKRVHCLYRVSTKGQVEKDDIPMQKQSCHEFVAEHDGWAITREFFEKGVSGFKVSAKERDAIQDLQAAAVDGEFDILLVFMFDRIGRKEDETPFVVEWFTRQGIEVWSVKEGQQRFDNHVDKLLNYIRFWQASGESIKTSIRTKTRMEQLTKEGCFKGGVAPLGYQLVKKGRVNKRGREVNDIEVSEAEAPLIELIFRLYVENGMGPRTIATYLTNKGITNRKGSNYVCPTIRAILQNPIYRGVLRCGDAVSEPFEHLRIIDDDIFFRAQEIREQRQHSYQDKRRIPTKLPKNCLLAGNIFCGHCGSRLMTSTSGRKKKNIGENESSRYWRYMCYTRINHKDECCGLTGYTAERLDNVVTKVISELLGSLKEVSADKMKEKRVNAETSALRQELASKQTALSEKEAELQAMQQEVGSALLGKSKFTPELLNSAIEITFSDVNSLRQTICAIEEELKSTERLEKRQEEQLGQYVSWSDIFNSCDLAQQRMIVCQLVDEVRVYRDYRIEIQLSISVAHYLEMIGKPEIILERNC